jgi:GNAT superfamily N-acetyltransferase
MLTMSADLRIEPAAIRDVPLILRFIRELAEYEQLAHACVATEEDLRTQLFGPNPVAHTVIAYAGDEPAGFALYFFNFSTFLARPGLYLEDLYVTPALRKRGIGRALLAQPLEDWTVMRLTGPAISALAASAPAVPRSSAT